MAKKLTILFVPMEGVGHVNACIGLAECLRDRGHKIVFAIDQSFKGQLVKYGFIEEILDPHQEKIQNPGEYGAKMLLKSGILSGMSSLDKMKNLSNQTFFNVMARKVIASEPILKAIINKYEPHIYILDHFIGSPQLIYSEKPWIFLFSGNPLFVLDDERIPPGGSGYPTNGDKAEWDEFRNISRKMFESPRIEYNKWLVENGYPEVSGSLCIPFSQHLNIYGYPEELDYTDIIPMPEKWFRMDAFIRKGEEEFKLPEKFSKNSDNTSKLIYVSLGSMGSVDVELMKRLVSVLSKCAHKFIVSKGIFHDKYELADNMWGEKSVPQTKVLPLVDLVITHGGNNTITEAFSFGKPMIVMPLFADQFDNAQRVDEKGFGLRLDTYNFKDEQLLDGIEKLLNDTALKERLSLASNRMLNSGSLTEAAENIEKLVI